MEITKSHVVITGGSSGLGLACVKLLLQKNAYVTILDVNEPLEKVEATYIACDVTNIEIIEKALQQSFAQDVIPRVLIQCAGIVHAAKTVARARDTNELSVYPIDKWLKVIDVNLSGTFRVLSKFATMLCGYDKLNDGQRGIIINTASVAATDGQIGQSAYGASKAGIMGMTLPIARDLAKEGIRINTILPGIFNTPMVSAMPQKVKDALGASIPFPSRLGEGHDFAMLALQMIENDYINGASYRLDGAVRLAPR